jgi:UDP-glucose 4-epimerase
VIEAVASALGVTPEIDVRPRRPGDPASLVADTTALRRHLAWEPAHSSISEIVSSAIAWERSRRSHARA